MKLLLGAPRSHSADNLSQPAEMMLQAQRHLTVNQFVPQKPSPFFLIAGNFNTPLLRVSVEMPPLDGDAPQGSSSRPSRRDLPSVVGMSNTNLCLVIVCWL